MGSIAVCPRQDHPPVNEQLFTREWWLYLYRLSKLATRATVDVTCDTGMALTDAYADVPDCNGVLSIAGLWIVFGVFNFQLIGPTENGGYGRLLVNEVGQQATAQLGNEGDFGNATITQFWPITVVANTPIRLQAKTNVTAAGHLNPDSTRLFALLLIPT